MASSSIQVLLNCNEPKWVKRLNLFQAENRKPFWPSLLLMVVSLVQHIKFCPFLFKQKYKLYEIPSKREREHFTDSVENSPQNSEFYAKHWWNMVSGVKFDTTHNQKASLQMSILKASLH